MLLSNSSLYQKYLGRLFFFCLNFAVAYQYKTKTVHQTSFNYPFVLLVHIDSGVICKKYIYSVYMCCAVSMKQKTQRLLDECSYVYIYIYIYIYIYRTYLSIYIYIYILYYIYINNMQIKILG